MLVNLVKYEYMTMVGGRLGWFCLQIAIALCVRSFLNLVVSTRACQCGRPGKF